jgi:tellurite resistance protein TerA
MGLFSKKAAPVEASSPVAASQGGKINLSKGSSISIKKTPLIRARASWASATDYDLYALVLLKTGEVLTVATFGTVDDRNPTSSVLNGAVRHLGDIKRVATGDAEEIIEIKMTDEIEAVFPIAYSAQSNGGGSFRQYKVSLGIDNGAGDEVTINSDNASKNPAVYTVAIGAIRNTPNGIVIEALENYSRMMSEKRPAIVNGKLVMDAGSVNIAK